MSEYFRVGPGNIWARIDEPSTHYFRTRTGEFVPIVRLPVDRKAPFRLASDSLKTDERARARGWERKGAAGLNSCDYDAHRHELEFEQKGRRKHSRRSRCDD